MNQQEVTAAVVQALSSYLVVGTSTGQSSLRISTGNTLAPIYRNTALTNTGVLVATGDRELRGWNMINNTANAVYVKVYNKASAATSSDIPDRVLLVPANGGYNTQDNTGFSQGNFPLGISIRCCTGLADNDNNGPSAGIYVEILYSV
jgi:hypothetical protein